MPKLERLKEELSIQKQLFFMAIAIVIAVLGWLTANIEVWPPWIGWSGLMAIVLSALFAYTRYTRMKQLLVEIEEC